MKEMLIKYNPYRLETTIQVDGDAPQQKSKLNFADRRLQEWVEELPEIIFEEYRTRQFKITFHGTILDFEDVEAMAREASKDGFNIELEHIPAKEVADKENAISEIFDEIQRGPFDELKQPDVVKAFNMAKSSDFEVNVVATMSAGKSTLINSLLRQKLMPAKQEACTATITEIKDTDGGCFTAKVYDADGALIQTHPELTFEIMKKLNSNPAVSKIRAEGNIPFVSSEDVSLVLVDTPGPNNSRDPEHRAATYRMLSESSKAVVSKENIAGKTIKGVASAASILGAALAPVTGGASLVVGGVVSGGLSMLGSAITSTASASTTTNESVTDGFSTVHGGSKGATESVNYGITKTEGYARSLSEGMTLTLHDKSIETTLERIDKQLKRIDEFESLGMYECAAYFLSDDSSAEVAASTYKALMRGENSGVEIAAINSWGQGKESETKLIAQYVKNFIHPVFKYDGSAGKIEVTPCSLVSANELSIHMGLPRKSVCGLPVIEHADFGREVVMYDDSRRMSGINLGKIFNMGSASKNNVQLSLDSLAMHTFITGSTGSGKSNTVYEIVRQLDNLGINYLVIEPAKGEYKNVFGNNRYYPGVRVYGTNPQHTELLRINPFKFPKGVHILEHIDRLIEIFNVCWPMYAAMPAVLKSAVEQSYIDSGWNLVRSTNKYGKDLYPSFVDVTRNIKTIIDTSEYDNENKGAYKGSLLTRLQSLTNGIYGMVFDCDDLDDAELFDKKVIVDLSRVGSVETKSLIMGMLVLKLQEYRMANATGMNEELKHVTILEEAHNLLKRTSTEQSSDGGNLRGKSVEMLTNAIAEMRTYGEGFVIADQAPGLLDLAVIRNTNTKIIMRLPDHSDRELVGRSANLNDDQIDELAKLPCGVAAVYQNDWVQPVLCKVSKYDRKTDPYKYAPDDVALDDTVNSTCDSLLECIMGKEIFGAGNRTEIRHLSNKVLRSKLDTTVKKDFIEYISASEKNAISSLRHLLYSFFAAEGAIANAEKCNNISDWVHTVVNGFSPSITGYSNKQIDLVLALILYEKSLQDSEYNDIFCRFTEIYKSEGGVF